MFMADTLSSSFPSNQGGSQEYISLITKILLYSSTNSIKILGFLCMVSSLATGHLCMCILQGNVITFTLI